MPGMNLKKMNREAQRKAKQQRKQQKRDERKQAAAADKDHPEPGAAESISPLQNREGAMIGESKSPPVHRAAPGNNSMKEITNAEL